MRPNAEAETNQITCQRLKSIAQQPKSRRQGSADLPLNAGSWVRFEFLRHLPVTTLHNAGVYSCRQDVSPRPVAALVRFASERSSSGDLEPRTKVTLSGNELCDKVTGDGLSDNFVKEHPVHEAPYRVYAAIRAAIRLWWVLSRDCIVLMM